jgi:hypothetical protein
LIKLFAGRSAIAMPRLLLTPGNRARAGAVPADVLMRSGRPVLLAPPGVDHLSLSSVLIAWKDTRESRRAVMDSIPLLRRAERVAVVAITREGAEQDGAQTAVDDVAAYLTRHDIPASGHVRALREPTVPEELLLAAEQHVRPLSVMAVRLARTLTQPFQGRYCRESTHCSGRLDRAACRRARRPLLRHWLEKGPDGVLKHTPFWGYVIHRPANSLIKWNRLTAPARSHAAGTDHQRVAQIG